jgi:hypothetical protein
MPRYFSPAELANSGFSADHICFGDSWFAHPFANLTSELENIHAMQAILILADVGLEASDMVDPNQRYLKMFKKCVIESAGTLKRVYLSAGGNDFAGWDDFANILLPDCSACKHPADCFDRPKMLALFTQIFGDLATLIAIVKQHAPNAEVRLHNYDYAIPDGRTIIGGGKWLKVPMDSRNVPNDGNLKRGGFRREVVATLIDTFAFWQEDLAAKHSNVVFRRTAGTISDSQWMDELHANWIGCRKLARVFAG